MAAPPEVTLKDLTGEWVMVCLFQYLHLTQFLQSFNDKQKPDTPQNKTLSDDTDAILTLQGIGWLTRKAIAYATVTLHCKQYTSEDGHTHIDIDQTATGGIKGTTELRELDWTERSHVDHIFGSLKGKSRWITIDSPEIPDDFLKEGWIEGEEENGGPNGERHIESFVDNEEKGWTGEQIWGFAIIDGKRYYTRRVIITKGSEALKVRLVYNWQGKK